MRRLSEQYRQGVTVRPVEPDDEPFLFCVYCSTRGEEVAAWGLAPAQQKMVLELQFRGQQQHYQVQDLEVDYRIILVDGRPGGQIIVMRSNQEIRLGDISLLPEHRGGGFGKALIADLCSEAQAAGKPVTLHVEKSNRAGRLYERLGFTVEGDTGLHWKMEWRPKD